MTPNSWLLHAARALERTVRAPEPPPPPHVHGLVMRGGNQDPFASPLVWCRTCPFTMTDFEVANLPDNEFHLLMQGIA